MSEELKPCPFCGAEIQKFTLNDHYEDFVYCNNCGAQGPNDVSKAEAARMWNLRRPEDALRGELARLREGNRWIPVDERLPEPNERVLCFSIGAGVIFATYQGGKFWDDGHGYAWRTVSHWQKIEPPQKEGER